MKIITTEKAIRELIRESMMNPSVGWESTSDLSDSPVSVSAVVDPSAAVTNPENSNFKPANRKELRAALSGMIDDISDDCAEDIFSAMKDAIEKTQEEDEQMKNDKKVEETVRAVIRKILKEAELPPVKKIPAGVHGGEYMRNLEKRKSKLKGVMDKWRDDEDAAPMVRADAPAAGRERKNVMQTDVGGASFKQIAQELGYASESGAKQAAEKAMAKVKFASKMDQDDLQIVVLKAMSDYIDFLNSSGELTSADVQLMKDHPNMVSELDGFREFLDKYVKREMRLVAPGAPYVNSAGEVSEATEKKTESGPKCPECGKNMKLSDKKEYESNGGKGYPRICTRCAEEE